jgi:hypothetical protein
MAMPPEMLHALSQKANAAFQQAAAKVIEKAKQTGTKVIVWDDGQVKELPPEQFEQRVAASDSASHPYPPRQFGLGKGKLTTVGEDDEHLDDFKEYMP